MARGAGRRTLELIRVKRLSERLFFVLPGRLAFRLLVLLPFQLSPHSNEFLWRERFRFSFRGLDHISVLRRSPAAVKVGRIIVFMCGAARVSLGFRPRLVGGKYLLH
jgi:hypothetical protein